jgi:hypothetical protein
VGKSEKVKGKNNMYKTPIEELVELRNQVIKLTSWNIDKPPTDGSLIVAQFDPDTDLVIARWMLYVDGDHVWETTEGDRHTKDPVRWHPLPPLLTKTCFSCQGTGATPINPRTGLSETCPACSGSGVLHVATIKL